MNIPAATELVGTFTEIARLLPLWNFVVLRYLTYTKLSEPLLTTLALIKPDTIRSPTFILRDEFNLSESNNILADVLPSTTDSWIAWILNTSCFPRDISLSTNLVPYALLVAFFALDTSNIWYISLVFVFDVDDGTLDV